MTNIENIYEKVTNEPEGGDSPSSEIYENTYVPIVVSLEVNHLNPNFTVLSDSSFSSFIALFAYYFVSPLWLICPYQVLYWELE